MIDKFIDDNTIKGKVKPNGILSKNGGTILYGIGIYLGETIKRNAKNSVWKIEEYDKESETNATLILQNGTIIFPIQRIIKRFSNGTEDEVYAYGYVVINELSKDEYWQKDNPLVSKNSNNINIKRPWWKVW